jgi:hypothetical protein
MLVEPTYVPQLFDLQAWAILFGLAISWAAVTGFGVILGFLAAARRARPR